GETRLSGPRARCHHNRGPATGGARDEMIFGAILFIAAAIAGAIATVTGFGIGSVLTPLLMLRVGTQLAVAAVSVPHFFATATRFWRLRSHVNRRILLRFGIPSAIGGLTGAVLHNVAANRALAV